MARPTRPTRRVSMGAGETRAAGSKTSVRASDGVASCHVGDARHQPQPRHARRRTSPVALRVLVGSRAIALEIARSTETRRQQATRRSNCGLPDKLPPPPPPRCNCWPIEPVRVREPSCWRRREGRSPADHAQGVLLKTPWPGTCPRQLSVVLSTGGAKDERNGAESLVSRANGLVAWSAGHYRLALPIAAR